MEPDSDKLRYNKNVKTAELFPAEKAIALAEQITPDVYEFVAADFLDFLTRSKYVEEDHAELRGMKLCRVYETLCFDPKFYDPLKDQIYSNTMLWFSSGNLNIMVHGSMEAHMQILDYFLGLERKLKIHKFMQTN